MREELEKGPCGRFQVRAQTKGGQPGGDSAMHLTGCGRRAEGVLGQQAVKTREGERGCGE